MLARLSEAIKNPIATISRFINYISNKLVYAAVFLTSAMVVAAGYLSLFMLGAVSVVPVLMLTGRYLFPLEYTVLFYFIAYNNFIHISLKLSNFILRNINFPEFEVSFSTDEKELDRALKAREIRISKIQEESKILLQYQKVFETTQEKLRSLPQGHAGRLDYNTSLNAYLVNALEEYRYHIKEQGIDVLNVSLQKSSEEEINSFIYWYLLKTRNRLVEWTISKEFALHQIQENKDELLAGMSEEKIAYLESNPRWCCSITYSLMRAPVYAVLSNGERRYFELLNIQKWLSRAVENPLDREIFPENREKITEIFLDLELLAEINYAVTKVRYSHSLLFKYSVSVYEHFNSALSYIFSPLFEGVSTIVSLYKQLIIITILDEEQLKNLENPYNSFRVNDYTYKEALEKREPVWKKIYDSLTYGGPGYLIDDVMLDQELAANIIIHDIGGYLSGNGQLMPIQREIEHVRRRTLMLSAGASLWSNFTRPFESAFRRARSNNENDPMILPNNRNYRVRERRNAAFEMD